MALYGLSSSMSTSLPVTSLMRELVRKVFTEDSWKLAIPALAYTLVNSLQYLAVSNFKSAATFAVTSQTKVLTTALFSVVLYGRSMSIRQWFSLLLLAVGVATVQIPSEPNVPTLQDLKDEHPNIHFARSLTTSVHRFSTRSATYEGIIEDFAIQHPQLDPSIGLTAILAAALFSGFAGVYFEKVVKDSDTTTSIWIRNVQLSVYSLFPALFVGVVFLDGADIAKNGFFVGYNWVVWTTIALQALGGIAVALVIAHVGADAKSSSTGVGIVVSSLASVWFSSFEPTASVRCYLLSQLNNWATIANRASVCDWHVSRPPCYLCVQ